MPLLHRRRPPAPEAPQRVVVPDDVQAAAEALRALDPLRAPDPADDAVVRRRQQRLDAAVDRLLEARDRGADLEELLALSRDVGAAETARWMAVDAAGGELPVAVADELTVTRWAHRHPVLLPD